MEIKVLAEKFSVCKVKDYLNTNVSSKYCFLQKTEEENSLVCQTEDVPSNTTAREDGWRGFRIQGVLDFSLIGILSKISTVLANAKIGIFAISTYNTDYILVKEENLSKAMDALTAEGYRIIF